MDDDKLFRKVAMERLSSPENLDQVMRVVPAKGWIALVCLFVFAAAAVAWACFGEIARQAEGQGVLMQETAGAAGKVIAALATEDSGGVRPGMEATVTLDAGETLTGKVVSVSNAEDQTLAADGAAIPESCLPGWTAGTMDRTVIIQLNDGEAEKAAAGLAGMSAQSVGGTAGWFCTVRITIQTQHPIQMILPD